MPRKKEETEIQETIEETKEMFPEAESVKEEPVLEETVNVEQDIKEKECTCRKKPCTAAVVLFVLIVLLIGVIAYQNLMPHVYDVTDIFQTENAHSVKTPNAYHIDDYGNIMKIESNGFVTTIGQVNIADLSEEEFNEVISTYTVSYGFIENTVGDINCYSIHEESEEYTIDYHIYYLNGSLVSIMFYNTDEVIQTKIVKGIK